MKYSTKQAGMTFVCASTVFFSSASFAVTQGLTTAVEAAYTSDDNVFREKNGTSDSFLTIAPDLSYTKAFGKHEFTAGYNGKYASYDKNTKENYTDHTVDVGMLLDLSKQFNVDLKADYSTLHESRGQSGVSANAALDVTTLDKNSVFAGMAFGRKEAKMQLELDYAVINTDYTNNNQDIRDRRDDTVSTRLFYNVGAKTKAFVETKQTNFNYSSSSSTLDSTETLYHAGLRWQATAKTQGEVKVGSFDKDFDSATETDGDGTSYEASITWSPKTYSNLTLTSSRKPQESAIANENFYTATLTSLNWNHEFSKKITVILDASQSEDDYSATRNDKTTNAGIAMKYNFRRWLDFGLSFKNLKRTSNSSANEFTDNTVMFSATLLHKGK